MQMEKTAVREDPLLKHVAGVTGSVFDTNYDWQVIDLAKSWLGKGRMRLLVAMHTASRPVRIAAHDLYWTFRPNGQAWWWLTLAVLIAFVAANYMR